MAETWDPPPHERKYFTNAQTGDMGWLVVRDGVDHIKLDRPGEDYVVRYRERDWKERRERRPMSIAQLVQVAFVADREFRLKAGSSVVERKHWDMLSVEEKRQWDQDRAKRSWMDLSEQEKKQWIEKGPREPDRKALYHAVMKVLAHLAE